MIVLSRHAARRMAERRIPASWVEAAITRPDHVAPDADPTLTRSFRTLPEAGGRVLKVVHRALGDDVLVVTAHLDRDARR